MAASAGSSGARMAMDPASVSAKRLRHDLGRVGCDRRNRRRRRSNGRKPRARAQCRDSRHRRGARFSASARDHQHMTVQPLFESLTRGWNSDAKSAGSETESRMLGSPSYISGGVPMRRDMHLARQFARRRKHQAGLRRRERDGVLGAHRPRRQVRLNRSPRPREHPRPPPPPTESAD